MRTGMNMRYGVNDLGDENTNNTNNDDNASFT